MYGLKTDWVDEPIPRYLHPRGLRRAVARWCPGCGDHGVLTAVQRLCRDEQLPPEKTVCVSGIGCSSRFPHYVKSYGFHGLHGRALPVACGIRARRPDLHIFVATGDGDCCSIGTAHWIHAVRYNMNMVVMLLDNSIYGLTKNQTSPTSPKGAQTNTHPRGWRARRAQSDPDRRWASPTSPSSRRRWTGTRAHLLATLKAAHRHPGFSFVRVVQRCPHYRGGHVRIAPERPLRAAPADAPRRDRRGRRHQEGAEEPARARPVRYRWRARAGGQEDVVPIGLLYRNEKADRYELYTSAGLATSRAEKIAALNSELNQYRV